MLMLIHCTVEDLAAEVTRDLLLFLLLHLYIRFDILCIWCGLLLCVIPWLAILESPLLWCWCRISWRWLFFGFRLSLDYRTVLDWGLVHGKKLSVGIDVWRYLSSTSMGWANAVMRRNTVCLPLKRDEWIHGWAVTNHGIWVWYKGWRWSKEWHASFRIEMQIWNSWEWSLSHGSQHVDRRSEGSLGNERLGIGDCWLHVVDSLIGVGLWSCHPALLGGHVTAVGSGVAESLVAVWTLKRFLSAVYPDMFLQVMLELECLATLGTLELA